MRVLLELACALSVLTLGADSRSKRARQSLAMPTEAHLRFHEDNVGAIAHFGMQTFAPRDHRKCNTTWPSTLFNPSQLDTEQWVKAAKSFGAKYFVLVADHFSGFSTWPTTAHNYSVAASPWRSGQGDIVADLIASCKKHGIRPAVYYSVHANWYKGVCNFNLTDPIAQRAFEDMAMLQLRELAQKYGKDLAELWFDAGIKQSDAFVARVDDFVANELPSTATCHSCANLPHANAVSWMGNENTVMPYPVWNANDAECTHHGSSAGYGTPDGSRYCPAHCDAVLRRHFWFYDKATYNNTANLNTPLDLLRMYVTSVGRGCNMILDMSPTDTGLIIPEDAAAYAGFGEGRQALFNDSIAAATTPVRGQAQVVLNLSVAISRGALELRENLTLGQTISNFSVDFRSNNGQEDDTTQDWAPLPVRNERCLTIGNRRIVYWDSEQGGNVTALRITVNTIQVADANGAATTPAVPHLRSVKVFDWDDPELDKWLVGGILTIK